MNYTEMEIDLIKSYQDLLEVQYHDKLKAKSTIKALIKKMLANMILWKIRDEVFDIDKAVGKQLDIIGKWVGVDRSFAGQSFENQLFVAYYDWNDTKPINPDEFQGGYYNWNTEEATAPYLNEADIVSTTNNLSDDLFRNLIRLKIYKNNMKLTCKNIDNALFDVFKGIIFVIWGDCMKVTVYYPYMYETFIKLAIQKNVMPIPTGVKVELMRYEA